MSASTKDPNAERYLQAAFNIGVYLAQEAVWHKDSCNWTSFNLDASSGRQKLVYKAHSIDLYNGSSGIAYFLSEIYRKKKDPIILDTLEGSLRQISNVYNTDHSLDEQGIFTGNIGVATALLKISDTLQREDLKKLALKIILQSISKDPTKLYHDLLLGIAGIIPGLIAANRILKDEQIETYILRLAEGLMAKAQKHPSFWTWPPTTGQTPLTGYSHGAAGIGLAFLELFKHTNHNKFHEAAMMSFNYERSVYQPQFQNWPDFRVADNATPSAPLNFGDSWCHGAPGIALSRTRAWSLINDENYKNEADAGLQNTYQNVYFQLTNPSANSNFSLCHGLAGNGDILLYGGQVFSKPEYVQLAKNVADFGINNFDKTGLSYPSGLLSTTPYVPSYQENFGLMLGIAGTGMFYLRCAAPEDTTTPLLIA